MTIMAVPRKLGDTSYKDLVALQNVPESNDTFDIGNP